MKRKSISIGQFLTEYRDGIKYSLWYRKQGSNRVNITVTYGDSSEVLKLLKKMGFLNLPTDGRNHLDLNFIQQEIRKYVKENNLFKDDYNTELSSKRCFCKECGQEI